MGESDRYIEYRNKYQPRRINFNINSPVVLIIIINFSVFLFVQFLTFGKITGDTSVVPFFYEKLGSFLVTASFKQNLYQPWSIITFSFFHFQFLNLLSNMLWLWVFGSILQSLAGNKHTFPIYFYGAFIGAIFFIVASYIFKTTNSEAYYLYGANTSVMAIALATTVLAPGFKIFKHLGNGFPIWILTLIYLFVDLAGMGITAAPFYVAHLAGALAGALYMFSYYRGYNLGLWMNNLYQWFMSLYSPDKKIKTKSIKEKVFYNTRQKTPYNKTANLTQQRIDAILDKIHQKGYNQLTEEEKDILKRASEEEL